MYHLIRVKSSSFAAQRLHQLNIKYGELTANEQTPCVLLFKGSEIHLQLQLAKSAVYGFNTSSHRP